ncbi:DUF1127 domain-containing protein [Roseivivax sp. CAU 1761]
MFMHHALRPGYASTGLSQHVAGAILSVYDRIVAWNDARRTVRALSALSDHELNDIGLSRGDIHRVARG